MEGWIKLHRKICEWEWYTEPNTAHLFIYLLLNANHETKKWRGIEVPRGALITGRYSLAESTGLSEKNIRTSLERLKSTSEVAIKSTNKYSIITIIKWDDYQISGQQPGHQAASKGPAKGHKQELKNDKNEKKEEREMQTSPDGSVLPHSPEIKIKHSGRGTRLTAEWKLPSEWGAWAEQQGMSRKDIIREQDKFRDYWIAKTGSNATKANWQATWRNWIRRHMEEASHESLRRTN